MADQAPSSSDSTDTGENDTDDTTDAPAGSDTETDWKAEAEKWKANSQKHEKLHKKNADAALRLKELEIAGLSEPERLQRERDEARQERAEAVAEAARLKAAVKFGLNEDDLELLGSGTPDEIEARAEKLAARLAASTPPPSDGKRQVNGLGKTPDDSAKGGSSLERDIREALGI